MFREKTKESNFIDRSQFLKKASHLLLGMFAMINFPFASSKFFSEKSNMFKTSKLPNIGPWPTLDPFLFCVHHNDSYPRGNDVMGPDEELDGRNLGSDFSNLNGWSMYHGSKVPGFPRHPHRGFETITIVDKGLIDHSDSLGYSARYGDGDVQWLTAGDGIEHSEMFPLLDKEDSNPIDFFQIWINLKSDNKRVSPNFSMFWKDKIPKVIEYDKNKLRTEVQVIAGAYKNKNAPNPPPNSWAVEKQNFVNIWKIKLDSKAEFVLPEVEKGVSRTLYFYKGRSLSINDQNINYRSMIEIDGSDQVKISSLGDESFILLLQARPINEPIVKYGPFVMNNRKEIEEAFEDYNRGGFGDWDWPDSGPVHGRKYKKFAIGDN